jgi:hypothetical protein
VFRFLGRLLRAWEIYSFIRYFSPVGYAVDKLTGYALERMRAADWVFLGAAAVLALLWVVELINWPVQIVLAILRATGAWSGVWPGWPPLRALAHPTFDAIVWWLLCGLTLIWALVVWLAHFLRRLWPSEQWTGMRIWVEQWRGGSAPVIETAQWHAHPAAPHTVWRRTMPRGILPLAVAWLFQVLVLV